MTDLKKERLLELLADQTLFGLSEEESVELIQLKREYPDWENDISLELAAAAIGLSNLYVKDELSADLRAKIFADADDFFNPQKHFRENLNYAPKATATAPEEFQPTFEFEPKRSVWQWLGWAIAAAACVALTINIWLTHSPKQQPEISENPKVIQPAPDDSTAAQKREQLLASAKDLVQIPLANPKNEKEVLGDVVWSNQEQKGYVRFRGLPANDPSRETYQLWIVDEAQNEKTPISGGVFNISKTGEIIVPINAELQVKKPKAVAVSKEKPGGVVVSAPERIVAIAKI
ncbi:MAG: anti-sigma factor [Pyrinomonadaceae bacterium]